MTHIKLYYSNVIRSIQARFLMALCFLISSAAHAAYDIGAPDTGSPLEGINSFLQDVVNWVSGPIAVGFSFLSIAGMAIVWAYEPKMTGAMGAFFRVIVAVIIILNVGVWITAYQGE